MAKNKAKKKKGVAGKKPVKKQQPVTKDLSELGKHFKGNGQSNQEPKVNKSKPIKGGSGETGTGNSDHESGGIPGPRVTKKPSPPGTDKPPRRPHHPPGPPTNAGHYYYVKGESSDRDFGREMDKYSIWNLLGTPEKPLEAVRIHGVPYHDYFRSPAATNSFDLTTTYPGLLIGTGYMHPIPPKGKEEAQGDFQSGFYFDWSTGLPVIPGSTVKGVLRSVFPKPKDAGEVQQEKRNYIAGILAEVTKEAIPEPAGFVEELETMLFLGFGAVYFDAYISGIPRDPAHKGKIFSEDYITPHKDPFSDPIPLRFLKISPEVTFRFQFRLAPIEPAGIPVKPGHIKDFFKTLLTDFGVGAKRNTGFGALMEKTG